jgi:hypothetical protein
VAGASGSGIRSWDILSPANPTILSPPAGWLGGWHLDTRDHWRDRRKVFEKMEIHHHLQPLLEGVKANKLSLALFKPAKIHDFTWKPCVKEFHGYSSNPWVIIGVMPLPHPPPEQQMELFVE